MSRSTLIIPTPLALLTAPLPHWVKMIWVSIRSYQGSNATAWPSLETIGERIINDKGNPMDKAQVSRGIKLLLERGFLTVEKKRYFACIIPPVVDHPSTQCDVKTLITHQQLVDHSSTGVDHPSTVVDHPSTPTEKKQLNTTVKSNKKKKDVSLSQLPSGILSYQQVGDHWNDFAADNDLPQVRQLTEKRKQWIRKRGALIWPQIDDVYACILESEWLLNDFRVTFDFIWKNEDNHNKILEGNYKNKKNNGTTSKKTQRARPANSAEEVARIYDIASKALGTTPGDSPSSDGGAGFMGWAGNG